MVCFYIDGQALAIKLPNQIGKVVTEMKRSLASFNDLCENEFNFDEIKDPQSEIYSTVTQDQVYNSNVPTKIKKRLVELTCLKDRCQEELSMVKEEMETLVNFIRSQISEINKYATAKSACRDRFEKGLISTLLKKRFVHEKYLQSLKDSWKHVINIPVSNTELPFLSAYQEKVETFWIHDCDCCDDIE